MNATRHQTAESPVVKSRNFSSLHAMGCSFCNNKSDDIRLSALLHHHTSETKISTHRTLPHRSSNPNHLPALTDNRHSDRCLVQRQNSSFSVFGLKDEKLIKSKPARKLKHANSIVESCEYFCKIDPHNFELYRFKVGAFLRHSVYNPPSD